MNKLLNEKNASVSALWADAPDLLPAQLKSRSRGMEWCVRSCRPVLAQPYARNNMRKPLQGLESVRFLRGQPKRWPRKCDSFSGL